MQICLLSKQFNYSGGGSERYAYELSQALAELGHEVDVFTLESREIGKSPSLHENISVTFIGERRRLLVTFETLYFSLLARRQVEFENYDLIHGTLMPASAISLSIRPPPIPLILTCHAVSLCEVRSHKLQVPTDYLRKLFFHPLNVVMDMATITRASKVISISSSDQKTLERYYPIRKDRITRIPHGVDTEHFTPDSPPHPDIQSDCFTLLHVGRLVSRKNVELALAAVAETEREDVELLIAGTGTHREYLESETRRLDISEQVSFLGFVPEEELPSLYASSDAFLFLPRYEGFGLTFLESLAAGTPVIGTPVGGLPDLVTHGEEGLLVDWNPINIAGAISRLANSPSDLEEMGQKARGLAERHTWETVAHETESVYLDCINL